MGHPVFLRCGSLGWHRTYLIDQVGLTVRDPPVSAKHGDCHHISLAFWFLLGLWVGPAEQVQMLAVTWSSEHSFEELVLSVPLERQLSVRLAWQAPKLLRHLTGPNFLPFHSAGHGGTAL